MVHPTRVSDIFSGPLTDLLGTPQAEPKVTPKYSRRANFGPCLSLSIPCVRLN